MDLNLRSKKLDIRKPIRFCNSQGTHDDIESLKVKGIHRIYRLNDCVHIGKGKYKNGVKFCGEYLKAIARKQLEI